MASTRETSPDVRTARPARAGRYAAIADVGVGVRNRWRSGELGLLPIAAAIAVIWAYFQSQSHYFLTPRNLDNLLLQISVIGTVAVGVVLVLLIGEIDLAVGSLVGLSAAVLGVLVARQNVPWWIGILAALSITAAIGALQGAWFAILGVPAFVVSLAGLLGWLGVQLHILGSLGTTNVSDPRILDITTSHLPPAGGWLLVAIVAVGQIVIGIRWRWRRIRAGLTPQPIKSMVMKVVLVSGLFATAVGLLNRWRGLPAAGLILLALVAGFAWIVTRTQFGRHLLAVGGNAEAAHRAGISVTKIRIQVLMLSGLLAGLGGVLSVSRGGAATTQTGGGTLLLEAIAAAVIGGTSLFGGRGTVWSALTGAVIMGSLANGLDLIGQAADIKYILEMVVLLLAVSVDAMTRRQGRKVGH